MIIAAQGLLALIPAMLVVLAAFLPHVVTEFSLDRFSEVTGMGNSGSEVMEDTVGTSMTSGPTPESSES